VTALQPTLFATAAAAPQIERARAIVVMVGSYDGSGNFGDIAQLGAALELVERLGPGVVALPVLEREYLGSHRELAAGPGVNPSPALFFDPAGEIEDDLVPVAAPAELAFGASYLYGGGYLNREWGARKLAMLAAAEALLAAGGATIGSRLASGLQVELGWIAGEGARHLRRFDPLGARDSSSQRALAELAGEAVAIATGDDAIGLLRHLPSSPTPAASAERLEVNVHFAEHTWVSDQPEAVLGFYLDLLEELGREAQRPVLARPSILYEDGRVVERRGVERLRDACAERGIEVAEPRLLRPAGLAEAAPWLREASLTLSCSYHLALTSLMLAVPAVLLGDNPYYAQKAAGLADDFGLTAAFAPAASTDAAACAGAIAGAALAEPGAAALRDRLAAAADRLRQRRAATEVELLARLGGGAAAALGERVEQQAARLRQRSAEPVELRLQLAQRQTELEELRHRATTTLEAEIRAQEAEARAAAASKALDTALQSRSWRLTAPLRRIGALLQRR
jgi:Polysaccharide pyruvyl transferase